MSGTPNKIVIQLRFGKVDRNVPGLIKFSEKSTFLEANRFFFSRAGDQLEIPYGIIVPKKN